MLDNVHQTLPDSVTLAARLVHELEQQKLTISTAESLTGGGLCARIVDTPGASVVLKGGVCTYATDTKATILGVSSELLAEHGPVHPQVAQEMARGAQRLYGTDIALATTGVAGPGPSDGHPAGTVYIACVSATGEKVLHCQFDGDRSSVRQQSIDAALELALDSLGQERLCE